jgi:hypothetical protein
MKTLRVGAVLIWILAVPSLGAYQASAACPTAVSLDGCGMTGQANYCDAVWDWPDGVSAIAGMVWPTGASDMHITGINCDTATGEATVSAYSMSASSGWWLTFQENTNGGQLVAFGGMVQSSGICTPMSDEVCGATHGSTADQAYIPSCANGKSVYCSGKDVCSKSTCSSMSLYYNGSDGTNWSGKCVTTKGTGCTGG